MSDLLGRVSSLLPDSVRRRARRWRYASQIKRGVFFTDEPEFARLESWIRSGDTVLDIGANVGHYTLRFAQLVGSSGRVIAVEPIPHTFAMLVENVELAGVSHVSFVNAAATAEPCRLRFEIPRWDWGGLNYYQARVAAGGGTEVLGLPMDAIAPPGRISFVKIDVEGQEFACLQGCREIISRDRPMLMVEGEDQQVVDLLSGLGYTPQRLPGSPNTVYSASNAGN